jgi:hypothetical protein
MRGLLKAGWRLLQMPRVKRRERLRVLATAVVVEVGLRVMPLDRLAKALGTPLSTSTRGSEPSAGDAVPDEQVLRHARVVDAVLARAPFGNTCLRRALVLGHLLRGHGPVLRIGAARGSNGAEMHAWLEINGCALGNEDGRFVPLRQPTSA